MTGGIRFQIRDFPALLFFSLVVLLVAVQGCSGIPTSPSNLIIPEQLPSPIPPFVATDQAAAIQARSTIQAGEALANNLSLTGTAVALDINKQITQVALQLTSSAATEEYFIRQTQASERTTATSVSFEATNTAATQEAVWSEMLRSATATQMMLDQYVQATSTQISVNELIRQDQSQRQSLEFRTWASRLSLLLSFAFGLFLVLKSTPWILLKFFGFQSWNGKPILVVPHRNGGFQIVDIGRSFGPGVIIDQNGKVLTSGGHVNEEIQNSVTARAQAAELILAAGTLPLDAKQRCPQQAATYHTSPNDHSGLLDEISKVEFRVLPADDQRVGEWLRDVEAKLLEEGEE